MADNKGWAWHYGCRRRGGAVPRYKCKRCKARGLTELWQSAHGGDVCRKCRDAEIDAYRAARAAAAAPAVAGQGGGKGAEDA